MAAASIFDYLTPSKDMSMKTQIFLGKYLGKRKIQVKSSQNKQKKQKRSNLKRRKIGRGEKLIK